MELQKDMDEATQDGLMTVVERMCLRDEIAAAVNPIEARRELTIESDGV